MLNPTQIPVLDGLPLFHGLRTQDKRFAATSLSLLELPARTHLLPHGVYIVADGAVHVRVPKTASKRPGRKKQVPAEADNFGPLDPLVLFDVLLGGDLIGSLPAPERQGDGPLLGLQRPDALAVTSCAATLLWISDEDFGELLENVPRVSRNLSRYLASRLRLLTERFAAATTMNVRQRVAHTIAYLAEGQGGAASSIKSARANDKNGLMLPVTQAELAELVGASPMQVREILIALRQQGAVSLERPGRIRVKSQEELS